MSVSVQAQISIRSRKLGVLIRDARMAHRKNITECAKAIGVTPAAFRAFEEGRKAPSLPELEVMAYYFELPVSHFWGKDARSEQPARTEPLDLATLARLRDRIIGALLQKARMDASLSLRAMAQETGIPVSRIKAYELGDKAIPLPELEVCAAAIGVRVESFFDKAGPIGQWMTQQNEINDFLKLPEEMKAFVCKPINRPFLELARKLSDYSTDKLRSVAEDILDITL
jgi:transcriptional regulator with XRE-family HTH domain